LTVQQDKSFERAQTEVAFGKKQPKFNDLKSPEEEKEEGQIQAPYEMDAGIIAKEDFPAFKEANIDKFHKAKANQHVCTYVQEIVRKPIQRDPNGKAIGRGSFWQRQPFDYSNREQDLPKTHSDRIHTHVLTLADRTKLCAKDDVSVDSRNSDRERASDWEMRTGVRMTTKDITFDRFSHNKHLEMAETSSGRTKLGYTPHERQYFEMSLKAKKQKVKKVLKQNMLEL